MSREPVLPTAAQWLRGALLSAALAATGAHAGAVGTASGTSISNTATFSYSYTGTSGATNASTTANVSFLVDRKVDLTLTDHNSAYNSAQTATPGPGTNPAVLRFTLTNTSNATLDFQVIAIDTATDPYGGTDSYDQTASVFVDVNGDGTYTAVTDTATFVDELASGSSIAVFVVGAIPSGAINGDISAKLLTATARAGGGASSLGAALTETAGAETPGSVDTVFADGAGFGDAARDAALGARDAFKVISTVLGISKSSSVINDPTNGATNPKRIPGATVRYSITINNPPAAGSTAQAVTLTDAIPSNTTYVAASMVRNGVADPDANAAGNDCDYNTTTAGAIVCQFGDMVANTTSTLTFDVTVNAGVAVNTTITNTGSAAYSISSVAQTPKTSTHDFLVDRKIDLTLIDHNAAYNSTEDPMIYPGSDDVALRYTLTNTGNGTQDFALADSNTTDPYGGTDNYNQNSAVRVDGNANGTYEPANDTATFVDELAAGASIAVFITANNVTPPRSDGDISAKLLTATARAGGGASALGAALTQTAGADTASVVDTVFSDGSGTADAARDAQLDAKDAFKIFAPQLTLTKSSAVISDPINGASNPKRLPGAVIRYTVTLTNTGGAGAAAQATVVTDPIPTNTTYIVNSITYLTVARTDLSDGDNCDWNATTVGAITCSPGNLPQGQSRSFTFDVTVD